MSFIRKKLDCGVYINLMETNKFKKNFVSVSFIIPHNIENAAFSSLLSEYLPEVRNIILLLRILKESLMTAMAHSYHRLIQ